MKIFKNRIFLILMVCSLGSAALGMVDSEEGKASEFTQLPGRQVAESTLHGCDYLRGGLYSVVFSIDGKMATCASTVWDGDPATYATVKIWNTNTCECTKTLDCDIKMSPLVFSPNGKILACGSKDGIIRILNADTLECIREITLKRFCDGYGADELQRVMRELYSQSSENARKKIRDQGFKLPECFFNEKEGDNVRVLSLAFSPDGKKLAIAGDDGHGSKSVVRVLDTETLECMYEKEHKCVVYTVAFSPDGKFLASGGSDGVIGMLNIETHEYVVIYKPGSIPSQLVFSPDGEFMAVSFDDGGLGILYTDTFAFERIIKADDESHMPKIIGSMAFSPDGKLLAFCSCLGGYVAIFDIDAHKYLWHTSISRAASLAFSPDGLFFAVVGRQDIHLYKNIPQERYYNQVRPEQRLAFAAITHERCGKIWSQKDLRWQPNVVQQICGYIPDCSWKAAFSQHN